MLWIGAMVEAAVGDGSAQTLMKEQEEQCDLNALWGEAVGVTGAVAFQQPVPFEFS
jgi:hypothetical protein